MKKKKSQEPKVTDALIAQDKGIFMSFLKKKGITLKSRFKGKIEDLPIKGRVIGINYLDMNIEVMTEGQHIIKIPKVYL